MAFPDRPNVDSVRLITQQSQRLPQALLHVPRDLQRRDQQVRVKRGASCLDFGVLRQVTGQQSKRPSVLLEERGMFAAALQPDIHMLKERLLAQRGIALRLDQSVCPCIG